jgi:signal transduction histidine kinase
VGAAAEEPTSDSSLPSPDDVVHALTSLVRSGRETLELETAAQRARTVYRLAGHEAGAAAFLGEAIAGSALEHEWTAHEVAALRREAVTLIGVADEAAASMAVFMAAAHSKAAAAAGPRAIELELKLLSAFADVEHASVWQAGSGPDEVTCVALVGAEVSDDVRRRAARAFRGEEVDGGDVHGVPIVTSAGRSAALVVRVRSFEPERTAALLEESALALAPFVEQERLRERALAQERMATEAGGRLFARLGFDLHDGPLQEIAALGADLHLLRAQAATAPLEVFHGRIDDALSLLRAIEQDVRALAGSMDSAGLGGRPFAELVQEAAAAATVDGLDVAVELSGDIDSCTPSQRIALLRVVQEALSNARRHSGAERAAVAVDAGADTLRAEVVDHGKGFDVEQARREEPDSGRLGLVGMAERVRLLDGTLEIVSRPGGPTAVIATIPRWRPEPS